MGRHTSVFVGYREKPSDIVSLGTIMRIGTIERTKEDRLERDVKIDGVKIPTINNLKLLVGPFEACTPSLKSSKC